MSNRGLGLQSQGLSTEGSSVSCFRVCRLSLLHLPLPLQAIFTDIAESIFTNNFTSLHLMTSMIQKQQQQFTEQPGSKKVLKRLYILYCFQGQFNSPLRKYIFYSFIHCLHIYIHIHVQNIHIHIYIYFSFRNIKR